MALEPITRQEKIIAGQDLTPITRMEMFLKNFGGGGGSVPKPLTYDYMPDGYPKKTIGTVTLMEEQEAAFTENSGKYMAVLASGLSLVEGRTYTVNWDGTEYECVSRKFNNILTMGNLSILGLSENSGEPFLYVMSGKAFATLDTSASHTISVKTTREVVTTMVEEFLPTIPADKLPTIPADKLPTIPVIEFTTSISDSIANDAQPYFTVSNLSYSEIYALVEKGNFQIKDSTGGNYRPIASKIRSSGDIFVSILVFTSTGIIYAQLVCNADQTRFFRNLWWQIEATQK